jgi:hypothetical protein
MSARVAVALALLSLVFGSPLHAYAKERDKQTKKLAWAGIHRGPLAPARAEALEALLLDELDGYESFRLVDAGGGALDDRMLAADAARVEKLIDDGVDLLLNFKDKKAIIKFEQAIEVFESKLTSLRDHEKLREALLAKAEALFQSGNRSAATETLKNLAALSPKRVPNKKTHPAKFVALWDRALEELGAPGRVMIDAEDPACTILFDGKPLGNAPAEVSQVLPGKHYVVARWPFYVRAEAVQVAPGREVRVRLDRGGPAETARSALLETIEKKQGPTDAVTRARRVIDLASADEVLVAAVREDNGMQQLLISKHGSEGEVEAIVLVLIQEGIDSEVMSSAVRQLGAVLFVEKRVGELEIAGNGEARPSQGLTGALFGRSTGSATMVAREPERTERLEPPDPPPGREEPLPKVVRAEPREELTTVETPIEEPDRSITKEWWFWVGVGAAFVGVAVVGGSFLLRPDPSSTEVELVVNLGGG